MYVKVSFALPKTLEDLLMTLAFIYALTLVLSVVDKSDLDSIFSSFSTATSERPSLYADIALVHAGKS